MLGREVYKPINIPVTVAMAKRKRNIPGRIGMIVDRKRKTATKISRKALIAVSLIGSIALLIIIGGGRLARFAEAAGDEGKIAFTSSRDGPYDIYVMDADGANVRRLTVNSLGFEPFWSPDGSRIAFTTTKDVPGMRHYQIYTVDSDGTDMKRLTTLEQGRCRSPSWSPDGEKIAFVSWGGNLNPGTGIKTFTMDSDGKHLEVLVDVPGWNWSRTSWSLDGEKIAFSNDRLGDGDYAIWVMTADGNKEEFINMPGSDIQAAWHPSGKSMVYANVTSSGNAPNKFDDANSQIYIVDADGQNARKLADGWCPSWSPDGKRIVFSSKQDGNWEIYTIDADGENLRRLTDNSAFDSYPHWWGGASYAVESAGKMKSTWGKVKQ